MKSFEIVAHRGIPSELPENTIPSFQRAIDLGAEAVELDVRLTKDLVPVVFHYFYLDEATSVSGPIFNYTYEELRCVDVHRGGGNKLEGFRISTLSEVLAELGGKIKFEIEVKGPERESSEIVSEVLNDSKHLWSSIEVTSYEPVLLLDIQRRCPGIPTDLLFPRSESWMRLDVIAYMALHKARLAQARAVHLHPTQLTVDVVSHIRSQGIEIHAWDVNDEESLLITADLDIPRICTDRLQEALTFRGCRWPG